MTISVHEALGVLYLSGELDMATAEEFRISIGSALDGRGELVLDLRTVRG